MIEVCVWTLIALLSVPAIVGTAAYDGPNRAASLTIEAAVTGGAGALAIAAYRAAARGYGRFAGAPSSTVGGVVAGVSIVVRIMTLGALGLFMLVAAAAGFTA